MLDIDLPLVEYLDVAAENDTAEPGHWRRGFETVRWLKAHSELKNLSDTEALSRVRATARPDWWDRVFEGQEDPELTFLNFWDKVRYVPGGEDPLKRAVELAERQPVEVAGLPTNAQRVLSVAFHRSNWSRGKPFSLPQVQLAGFLGLSSQGTISKAVEVLERHGFLRREPNQTSGKGTKRRAELYTYHGPKPAVAKETRPTTHSVRPMGHNESKATIIAASKPPTEKTIGFDLPCEDGTFTLDDLFLAKLISDFPNVDVDHELFQLADKLTYHPEKRPRRANMPAYIAGWMKRAKNTPSEEWLRISKRQKGKPADGEEDGKGNTWSQFNNSWMPAESWMPWQRLQAAFTISLLEAYRA